MVNIVIKTLKNQKLDLEVQDDDTILDIKKKINEQHKLGPPESQKLIHRGKILQNDSTVKTIGFKEKDFVVVMVKKAKPKVKTNKTSTQQTTSSTTTSNTNTNTNTNTSNTNTSNTSNTTSSTTTSSTNNNNNNDNVKKILDETSNILSVSEMITGPENIVRCVKMLQEKVNEIISPRKVTEEDCKIALRAAYNFPARAGNILLDETQLNIEKVKFQQQREQVQQQQQQQTGNTGGTGNNLPNSNPTGNPLQGLGQNPLGGNQLINLIGQLARTNPDLMRAIQNDPQALQRALQDPQLIQQLMSVMILQRMQQESNQGGNQQGQQGQGGGLGGLTNPQQGQQGQQGGNRPGVIRISQEDQQKIQQVMEFTGCQHRDAAEAYFACDKNIELAVNYVLTEQSNSRLQFQAPQTTTTTTTTTQPQQQQQQEEPKTEEKPKEENNDDKN